jgi:uncharacterized membrane protein
MTASPSLAGTTTTSASPDRRRERARLLLAFIMVAMGILHFAMPGPFVRIVPAALPAPLALVLVSGVFEVLGGIGLLVPRVRRAASVGLVLLYLAVFPANINMTMHPEAFGVPAWALWARLPLQALFIAWALWTGEWTGEWVGGVIGGGPRKPSAAQAR